MEGSTHVLRTNTTSASEHPCATERANQRAGSNGRQALTVCAQTAHAQVSSHALHSRAGSKQHSQSLLYFGARQGSAHSLVVVDGAVCELNVAVFDVYSPALGRAPQVLALRHVPQENVESRAEMEGLSTHVLRTNTKSASEHPCVTQRANHYQQVGSY